MFSEKILSCLKARGHDDDRALELAGDSLRCTCSGEVHPFIVGLYNYYYARIPTWTRSKLIGTFGPNIDYVVRPRIRDSRKAEIWITPAA